MSLRTRASGGLGSPAVLHTGNSERSEGLSRGRELRVAGGSPASERVTSTGQPSIAALSQPLFDHDWFATGPQHRGSSWATLLTWATLLPWAVQQLGSPAARQPSIAASRATAPPLVIECHRTSAASLSLGPALARGLDPPALAGAGAAGGASSAEERGAAGEDGVRVVGDDEAASGRVRVDAGDGRGPGELDHAEGPPHEPARGRLGQCAGLARTQAHGDG
jgi:hypothetical protein